MITLLEKSFNSLQKKLNHFFKNVKIQENVIILFYFSYLFCLKVSKKNL